MVFSLAITVIALNNLCRPAFDAGSTCDEKNLKNSGGPASAEQHFMLRCARDSQYSFHTIVLRILLNPRLLCGMAVWI